MLCGSLTKTTRYDHLNKKVRPTSGNAHNRSFSDRKNVIFADSTHIMTTNYEYDLYYHVEFEGRDCVLVEAFVMSVEDSW